MTEKDNGKKYPVRTLHEFIYEINREWGRFKKGSLLSITISLILLVASSLLIAYILKRSMEVSDVILLLLLVVFLVYNIYLMIHQFRFFRKWENRMKQLTVIEEKLMPETEENKA